jgi:GNAT superfamily N-acetyltransferase
MSPHGSAVVGACLTVHPLTPSRWVDFEALFGENGACGGCWCMLWRLERAAFERQKGSANRRAMQALVHEGATPGLIAYADGMPAGWCALAPRPSYPALERSRILKPVDETPVWSVTCFFVTKTHRRQGISVALLRAAIDHVARHGGSVLEGYPVDPSGVQKPAVFVWTGLASAFRQAGFVECARRSATRPIMRYYLQPRQA